MCIDRWESEGGKCTCSLELREATPGDILPEVCSCFYPPESQPLPVTTLSTCICYDPNNLLTIDTRVGHAPNCPDYTGND